MNFLGLEYPCKKLHTLIYCACMKMSTYINEAGIDELSLMVHIILQWTEGDAIVVI